MVVDRRDIKDLFQKKMFYIVFVYVIIDEGKMKKYLCKFLKVFVCCVKLFDNGFEGINYFVFLENYLLYYYLKLV